MARIKLQTNMEYSDPRLRLDRIVNVNGNGNANVNVNGYTPLVYRFLENGLATVSRRCPYGC